MKCVKFIGHKTISSILSMILFAKIPENESIPETGSWSFNFADFTTGLETLTKVSHRYEISHTLTLFIIVGILDIGLAFSFHVFHIVFRKIKSFELWIDKF